MRVGTNPNRDKDAPAFTDVVLTCVTHLPNLIGYHKDRFEIVKLCLESMRKNAGGDYSIIVWDNGSCEEFRRWVRNEYKPTVFIESVNMGKTLARFSMARMLDPETVFCYSDDDMLFYPNWLNPQLEILKRFPNVSAVSGYPVRTQFRWGTDNTKAWGSKYGKMKEGRFIPTEWEKDFAVSIGRDVEWHIGEYTKDDNDYLIEYNGLEAYATAHHCQFIGYAGNIGRLQENDKKAMGEERGFDVALDGLGLRLTTKERHVRHMGNVIHKELRAEINQMF